MIELSENMAWPPVDPTVRRDQMEWGAWYAGTPAGLSTYYSAIQPTPAARTANLFGRVVQSVSDAFWGAPPAKEETRVHLPLASDIASAASDLLFGEEVPIDWGRGNEDVAGAMEEILDRVSWQSILAEAGEVCAAMGGMFLRAGWDDSLAPHPLVSVVQPDAGIVDHAFGIPRRILFWFTEADPDDTLTVYRHIEIHEPGTIRHQLWRGSTDRLGRLVPLTERPSTASLADVLDGDDYILTGATGLTAAYVPNIRPTPAWRAIPSAHYLGRSDFGARGTTGLFSAIDETWTSWMRDIRHGRSRLLVSAGMLDPLGPGRGMQLDLDREIYEELRIPAGENPSMSNMISSQQFSIRVEEHSRTIRELTLAAVQSCGYSGSTFGLDTEVAKTATEVGAVRGRTRDTREKKTRYWTNALEGFLMSLVEINADVFGGPSLAAGTRPRVDFPAFATPGPLELGQVAQSWSAAQAASTQTLVQLIHPDWDSTEIEEEVARINESNAAPAPVLVNDPFAAQDELEPEQSETPEPEE